MSDHAASNIASMPSRAAAKPLKECQNLEEAFGNAEFMRRIQQSVPRHLSPDRMLRTFVQAISKTPALLQCNMRSVLGAMLTCSQVGLEPNTPLGHAYLIPFKGRAKVGDRWVDQYEVQLIFGYQGLLELSYRSKMLTSVHADVVWPGNDFSFEYGSNAHLKHIPRGRHPNATAPEYAYMHAQLADGQAFEVLPWDAVMEIRNSSQGFRAAAAARNKAEADGKPLPKSWTEAPWVRHEIAMARKTAFRSGSKWLPRSVELASAIALDEAQDRGRIDFGSAFEGPTIDGKSDYLTGAVDGIDDGGEAFGTREPNAGNETASQQATARPKPEPEREKPKPQAIEFDGYLTDAFGEPAENYGNGGHFTDPVAWAKALEQLAGTTANIGGLIEMNADAIADAEAASGAVAAYVSRVMAGKGTPAAGSQIVIPTKNGRPDLAAWLTLCREAFAAADAETLDTIWRQVDALSAKLPQATRAAIAKNYANRKDVLGMAQVPAGQEASQGPAIEVAEDGDRPDPFEAIASELIDQIHETGNSHEMEALRRNAAVASQLRRLEAEAPALADRVKAAVTRHSQSWGQPTQD